MKYSFTAFQAVLVAAFASLVWTPGDGPWTRPTMEQRDIKVTVVTKGSSHPWSLAFLPDGTCDGPRLSRSAFPPSARA